MVRIGITKPISVALLATLSAAIVFTDGCAGELTTPGIGELEPEEVSYYQGKDLSSIDDFRENSIEGPQQVDLKKYRLNITGLVENPRQYSYDEILEGYQGYRKVVSLDCVEGWEVTILWEGVLVKDILAEAGPLPESVVVIFHAHDGYTTSLPLDYIIDNDIMMAYKMNDIVLPAERGFPFQLVAESK